MTRFSVVSLRDALAKVQTDPDGGRGKWCAEGQNLIDLLRSAIAAEEELEMVSRQLREANLRAAEHTEKP